MYVISEIELELCQKSLKILTEVLVVWSCKRSNIIIRMRIQYLVLQLSIKTFWKQS